jgi:Flp pilus assembly protein CpaB
MVLLGIAFFVVGLAAVYLVTNDDDGGGVAAQQSVVVVVARQAVPAGSLGSELVKQGALEEVEVPASQRLPDAAGSITQLSTVRFVTGFAQGQQITLSGVQPLASNIEVPEGFEAVAVQLDFIAGGAEYVTVNDRVNLYGLLNAVEGRTVPRSELMLTNVTVLDVNRDTPARRTVAAAAGTPTAPERVTGGAITLLLALRTDDVEKLVFMTEYQGLYASILAKDAPAAGPTDGQDNTTILDEEPNVAANS